VKYYETIFDLLARQYEVARVDEARQGSVVQIVDRATVPDQRSFPVRSLIVLGAAAFGLIIGIFWVLTLEELRRLSNSPAENFQIKSLRKLISPKKKGEAQL
jgi:tyrosine-protein kinase Etk/Wzc